MKAPRKPFELVIEAATSKDRTAEEVFESMTKAERADFDRWIRRTDKKIAKRITTRGRFMARVDRMQASTFDLVPPTPEERMALASLWRGVAL